MHQKISLRLCLYLVSLVYVCMFGYVHASFACVYAYVWLYSVLLAVANMCELYCMCLCEKNVILIEIF